MQKLKTDTILNLNNNFYSPNNLLLKNEKPLRVIFSSECSRNYELNKKVLTFKHTWQNNETNMDFLG